MDDNLGVDGTGEMDKLFCKVDFLIENPGFEERLLKKMRKEASADANVASRSCVCTGTSCASADASVASRSCASEDYLLSDEELLKLAAAGKPDVMKAVRLKLWEDDVNG